MVTLGVIVGNRGFFPAKLCEEGRKRILAVLEQQGIRAILLDSTATTYGAVESLTDARKCADLFRAHHDQIDGVIVTLPNFGDERAVANTLRWAELNVPVLIHAFNDDVEFMTIKDRRDSFCGKMSVCNNLKQYGIKFTLTQLHTCAPEMREFQADLLQFVRTCKVYRKLKRARLGAIGARPAAFNTVRYSEKLLEKSGISVETLDLSELLGWAAKMGDQDAEVVAKIKAIQQYTQTGGVPQLSVLKMAKLGVGIDRFIKERQLDGTAIQCWTSLEEFYGVVPCTLMSMLSNQLQASACETDIPGLVGMIALQAAAEKPAALLDWNNNYGTDPNKAVVFHCSNLPKDFFADHKMDFQEIIAGSVGKENAFGTIVGRVAPGPFTYCRVTTDEFSGKIKSYLGEAKFTGDKLETFGGYGVIEVPRFQSLLRYICENGFEHHVAATRAEVAGAIAEALGNYLGWEVYQHLAKC